MSIGPIRINRRGDYHSGVRGTPLVGFMVRKEPKGPRHQISTIEGPVKPGDTAVIGRGRRSTTGGSSLQAIECAEAFGLKIVGGVGDHRPHGRRGGSVRPARLQIRQLALDSAISASNRRRSNEANGYWLSGK